jgi:hypothetical protein
MATTIPHIIFSLLRQTSSYFYWCEIFLSCTSTRQKNHVRFTGKCMLYSLCQLPPPNSHFSLLSAVFSFVFVWQLCTFSRRSCKQCELFLLHVNTHISNFDDIGKCWIFTAHILCLVLADILKTQNCSSNGDLSLCQILCLYHDPVRSYQH